MKKNLTAVVAGLACVLTVVCLIKIASLQSEVISLRSNLSAQMAEVNASVSSNYYQLESKLNAQASLLSDSSYAYGAPDMDSQTVPLICAFTPKSYSPEGTLAEFVYNAQTVPMTLENGTYVARVEIPIFSRSDAARVQFTENGVTRTEILGWTLVPRYEFLPYLYARFVGSLEGGEACRTQGSLEIDLNVGQLPAEVKALAFVEVLDGKEIGRESIPLVESANLSGETAAVQIGGPVSQNRYFSYAVDKSYALDAGSVLEQYVEMTDGYGLRYRALVNRAAADAGGNIAFNEDGWQWQGAESLILDENGEVLYRAEDLKY